MFFKKFKVQVERNFDYFMRRIEQLKNTMNADLKILERRFKTQIERSFDYFGKEIEHLKNTMNADLKILEQKLKDFRVIVESRFQSHEKRLDTLRKDVQASLDYNDQCRLDTIERLSNLDTHVLRLGERIDEFEVNNEMIKTKLDDAELTNAIQGNENISRIDSLAARTTILEEDFLKGREARVELWENIDNNREQLRITADTIYSIQNHIDILENKIAKQNKTIKKLKQELNL